MGSGRYLKAQFDRGRAEIKRLRGLLKSWGITNEKRCGGLCPLARNSYSYGHRCLLPEEHDGEHIFECTIRNLRAEIERLKEISPS